MEQPNGRTTISEILYQPGMVEQLHRNIKGIWESLEELLENGREFIGIMR